MGSGLRKKLYSKELMEGKGGERKIRVVNTSATT